MISFTIEPKVEKKLKEISELASQNRVELDAMTPACREAIHRYARISMIGASTRIENAVLTDTEIDWMDARLGSDSRLGSFERHKCSIEDKLSKDKERSIEEVAGLRVVSTLIYDQAAEMLPLKESAIRGLHTELLQYYSPAAHYVGQYKAASNSVVERVGNQIIREVFKTADPGPMTSAAMQELVAWYNQALPNAVWVLPVISEFVYRFLAIHPFQDGNGRLARALFLLGLLQAPDRNLNAVARYLAIDRQIEKSRAEYYIVLRQCSGDIFKQDPKEYHIEIFLNFMLKMVERSLNQDIVHYAQKYEAYSQLAETTQKILDCFREHPEDRLQSGQIAELTGIPRRTVTRALQELSTSGFLQQLGKGPGTRYQLVF
jgi:Fic family protein